MLEFDSLNNGFIRRRCPNVGGLCDQVGGCCDYDNRVSAKKGFGPGEQDYGYVEVRPQAHMFWWLYETTANVTSITNKPLVIWLQGGPGSSSTGLGNFGELGPLDENLQLRNYSWVQDVNVLFIDNPVGVGFSYVENHSAYAKTNREIADDLVKCLEGFYEKRPDFLHVPLYITGESYGGKMLVEFALELYEKLEANNIESNLKGIALVDSWISPIDSVSMWAPYLYNIGAVDKRGFEQIKQGAEEIRTALEEKDYSLATQKWDELEMIVEYNTYGVDFYNILKQVYFSTGKANDFDEALSTLMNGPVKSALGLNATWSDPNGEVFEAQTCEFMKPVTTIVEQLLNTTNIKIFVLSGQLDLIVDTPGTVAWVDRLQWQRKEEWKNATREALVVNDIVEGYKKVVGKLSFYWVNRSGHMVPRENPQAMRAILRSLVKDVRLKT
ncbi:hypothetical protein ILUMI_07280 [Ignelater luminosus]|uniref:Carboxypeptidase n=1 Tax=Ignelater luminosus TaxID=2038154 RepID=A0A8K0D9M2_IGNLU|nr:hypothetical protein ILUMI_07280 [Ignelater luminosus]